METYKLYESKKSPRRKEAQQKLVNDKLAKLEREVL